jgi:hypothetical protein
MRRIGARHKRPQRFSRNEYAAKHADGRQRSARDQALYRSHGDPAELFRGLSEAICKSFMIHLVHPVVFVQYSSSIRPVSVQYPRLSAGQPAAAKASAMCTFFRASLTPETPPHHTHLPTGA